MTCLRLLIRSKYVCTYIVIVIELFFEYEEISSLEIWNKLSSLTCFHDPYDVRTNVRRLYCLNKQT